MGQQPSTPSSNLTAGDPSVPTPMAERILASTLRVYRTRAELCALRCALGDAAALCDGISRDVAAENHGRGGKGAVTKLGLQLEAIAKRCGDAIWAMREKIDPDESTKTADGTITSCERDE